ncbi:MAG TPA: 50S ribosomal protein L10 [Thermomicrobiales bacterium]|nr:50S ribosomal protein L10 [Thermomicrobiales bacterium]
MPTAQKAIELDELTDRLTRSQLTIITDYRGLDVSALQGFRARVRPMDAEFRIAKNTLTRIAAERVGIEGLAPQLEGPTAILFAYGDVVAPAKAVSEFVRSSRILQVRAGVMNGQILGPSDVEAISSLPPREELLGKLVGLLASPMARTVGVLSGPSRSVVYLTNARVEQLGGVAEAAD